MAQPKVGDVVKWKNGNVWEIVEITQNEPSIGGTVWYEGRGRLVSGTIRYRGFNAGSEYPISFCGETVESSGWEYVETEFQKLVREVLDTCE